MYTYICPYMCISVQGSLEIRANSLAHRATLSTEAVYRHTPSPRPGGQLSTDHTPPAVHCRKIPL